MNMSLRQIEINGAPTLECRAIHSSITLGHLAGIPLKPDDEIDPVHWQKLDVRVKKDFGDVRYAVLPPELFPLPSGALAFPKIERMSCLFAPDTSEAVVLVWFEQEDETFMSATNQEKLQALHWKDIAGRANDCIQQGPAKDC